MIHGVELQYSAVVLIWGNIDASCGTTKVTKLIEIIFSPCLCAVDLQNSESKNYVRDDINCRK